MQGGTDRQWPDRDGGCPRMDRQGNAGIQRACPGCHFDPAQDLLLESSDVVLIPAAFAPRDAQRQPTDVLGRHPAHLDDRAPPRVNRGSAGLGPARGFPLRHGCAAGESQERSDQSLSLLLDAAKFRAFRLETAAAKARRVWMSVRRGTGRRSSVARPSHGRRGGRRRRSWTRVDTCGDDS